MNAQDLTRPSGTILSLGCNAALIEALRPPLAGHGLALETFLLPADLSHRVQASVPVPPAAQPGAGAPGALLALIDLRAFPSTAALAGLGADGVADQGPHLPLACLGSAGDLPQRLAALRAGAAAWFPADLAAADLAARLAALVGPADGTPERVLVVDDQPVSALFAVRVLEHAGMVAQHVADPLLVLSALDRFAPDLVLMDLHMPGVSGIELTAVIREQGRFAELPIVFLSVELDPERQLEALRIGGDDFLAKPVPPGLLVSCVRRRLARSRMRQRCGGCGTAVTPHAPPGDRERLLARLDHLIRIPAGQDWALVYLEQPGEPADLTRLIAAVCAHAGMDALTARVGEHGIGVLVPGGAERRFGVLAEALGQGVRADLRAAAGSAQAPPLGVGWCPLPAGGGESVTLVSRARKAACLSLQGHQGRAQGYVVAPPAQPDALAASDPVLAALTAGRFQLLFQPMVPLSAAPAERYEATPRLAGPQGELLAPSVFVPLARRAGHCARIDRWLLAAGLDALRERRAAGRPVDLFLHQSMVSAAADAWVNCVRDEINVRDLIQCRPIVQWQSADVECNLDLATRRAGQLERLRIRLCLNGFAADERSDRVLERLSVAYVRLASQALRDLPPTRLQDLVIRLHRYKVVVIATGVEGPEAITALYRAGVDLIQGPYVQPPAETMGFDFAEAVG